jgi:uncharacterized heparinase superfamily protein
MFGSTRPADPSRALVGSFLRRLMPVRKFSVSQLLVAPQDLRVADPIVARDMLSARYLFGGRLIDAPGQSPFQLKAPGETFERELYAFGWLRHFATADASSIQGLRRLLAAFAARSPASPDQAFAPAVLSRRLVAMIAHSPMILTGADHAFHQLFLGLLTRDLQALRAMMPGLRGADQLPGAIANIYAAIAMKDLERQIAPAARQLASALTAFVLSDGVHASRNPAATIDIAFDLLPLRQAFAARERDLPKSVSDGLARILRGLRLLTHRGGQFALFNGAGPIITADLATLLAYDRNGVPAAAGPESGYRRIEAGGTTVVVDAGAPPPRGLSAAHCAAPLAFEFSHGEGRIVTSCGAPGPLAAGYAALARATAAHSTLIIDDTTIGAFDAAMPGGGFYDRGAGAVSAEVAQADGWTILDGRQDGYQRLFGLIHRRRIAVADDGLDISGDDRLEQAGRQRRMPGRAMIRFHLDPHIGVTMSSSGTGVALDAPGGGVWMFTAGDQPITVEESIDFSSHRGPRRTMQLVIEAAIDGSPTPWRFTRL